MLSRVSSYLAGISIVSKFVFWGVLLLLVTMFAALKTTWNNQSEPTHDWIYWQTQYSKIAGGMATDPKIKDATLNASIQVNQLTLQTFPFSRPDGTSQVRVDRCQSCHVGLDNPQMTAENIIHAVNGDTVNASGLQAYLSNPDHKELFDMVKVLSAHPGKTGGLLRGQFTFALPTNDSVTPSDKARNGEVKDLMAKHAYATYGCTTCHFGSGRELQQEKAHGTTNEGWLAPILPAKYMDAACAQCHTKFTDTTGKLNPDGKAVYLPQMQTIAKGQDLFKANACWGCHKVEGFSKGNVGPELTLEGNISRYEYIEHQLWDPRYKVNNCVMPYFFSKRVVTVTDKDGVDRQYYLSDFGEKRPLQELEAANKARNFEIEDKETRESLEAHGYVPDGSNEDKITAITCYILSQTGGNYSENQAARVTRITSFNAALPPDVQPTAQVGKQLFETSGCLACHFLGEPNNPQNGKGGGVAPNLSFEGSRHSKQWIKAHYVNPQAFVPKSIMPVFPFSDSQRQALTEFDAQNIPTGARPVSPDQDMVSPKLNYGNVTTNAVIVPQTRYMTR